MALAWCLHGAAHGLAGVRLLADGAFDLISSCSTSGFDRLPSCGLQAHHHVGWQRSGQPGQARGDTQPNRIPPARGLAGRPTHRQSPRNPQRQGNLGGCWLGMLPLSEPRKAVRVLTCVALRLRLLLPSAQTRTASSSVGTRPLWK
jgi:hypothetical protein